jgi:HlyD family secretion protein
MKEVQIGISDDTYIEVIRGLKEGEEVISGPYKVISRELKEGSKVKLEDYKNKKRMNS